jgi:hypothetical protein
MSVVFIISDKQHNLCLCSVDDVWNSPCAFVLRRIGEWVYSSTHSLTSALDGDERTASRLGCFTPRERSPGTHQIGGWVGPRAVLDAMVKREIPSSRRESNPRNPISIHSLVAVPTELITINGIKVSKPQQMFFCSMYSIIEFAIRVFHSCG